MECKMGRLRLDSSKTGRRLEWTRRRMESIKADSAAVPDGVISGSWWMVGSVIGHHPIKLEGRCLERRQSDGFWWDRLGTEEDSCRRAARSPSMRNYRVWINSEARLG